MVAFVPKLQGIPYFEAMNAGGKQAARRTWARSTWEYQGPTTADAGAQAQIVALATSSRASTRSWWRPTTPNSMAPMLAGGRRARASRCATSDTDAPDSVREVFVSQASTEGIGQGLTDPLMEAMGGPGEYAIVSCGETAENLNSWIEVQKDYTASEVPGRRDRRHRLRR